MRDEDQIKTMVSLPDPYDDEHAKQDAEFINHTLSQTILVDEAHRTRPFVLNVTPGQFEMHPAKSGKRVEIKFGAVAVRVVKMLNDFSAALFIDEDVPKKPPLQSLAWVNDLLPSPKLRKTQKKMMADQAAHIHELREAGRHKAAKWQQAWTWMLWGWHLVRWPAVAAVAEIVKRTLG